MQATYATDLDELKNWVAGVGQLPKFLRTKEARALFDALEDAGFAKVEALLDHLSVDEIAARVGRSRDALLAALRKCPFGLSL